MAEEEDIPVEMKRYEEVPELERLSSEVRQVPKICPLINSCEQIRADKTEYKQLVQKWTAYAQSQKAEKIKVTGRKGKKETITLKDAQPVTGTQVFYLEYKDRQAKQERFKQMCPHFKKDILGLPVANPPYHDCTTFSEWFYSQRKVE